MKKNFLYSMVALFVCLFTACSQEEIVSQAGQNDSKVRLSVKVPAAGPIARAALDVEGYTMQCIMELVGADGQVIADSRQTVTVTNGAAHFEFDKPSGEYTCLFWAEYLKEGKSFYKTSAGLTKISYDGNKKNELFNNTAADAFCGKLASSNITVGVNVTLKRPFARIAISKNDFTTLGTDLNQCTASIFSGTDFNVFTGTAASTVNIKNTEVDNQATPISIDANNEYPFFCYVFIGDAIAKPSNITFFSSEKPETQKTLSITAEQMKTMSSNTAVNLKPETGGDSQDKINVDIIIDNEFENGGGSTDPETPTTVEVGDYLYADGTWGKTAKNAVAVVYHVGVDENDKSTYNMLEKVNGYAVALTDAATEVKYADVAYNNPTNIAGAEQNPQNNKSGYLNSHLAVDVNGTAYNQLPPVKAALEYNVALTEGKTSGWYLPTVAQLEEIRSANLKTVTFAATNYWSCVIASTGKVFRVCFDPDQPDYNGMNKASNANSAFNVRPILTF